MEEPASFSKTGWPTGIVWLGPKQCLQVPAARFQDGRPRLFVFRPGFAASHDSGARQVRLALEKGLLVRLVGLAPADRPGGSFASVHAFEAASEQVVRRLAFRDYLRSHPEVAQEYSRLKRELAARHPSDSEAHDKRKAPFIEETARAAVAWWQRESGGSEVE